MGWYGMGWYGMGWYGMVLYGTINMNFFYMYIVIYTMSQCRCLTRDGKGSQCSRPAKVNGLCSQHSQKCPKMLQVQQASQRAQHRQPVQKPIAPKSQRPIASAGCVEQSLKRYVYRPSPPFPANQCCGEVLRGNNGRMYLSKPDVNGICRWQLLRSNE